MALGFATATFAAVAVGREVDSAMAAAVGATVLSNALVGATAGSRGWVALGATSVLAAWAGAAFVGLLTTASVVEVGCGPAAVPTPRLVAADKGVLTAVPCVSTRCVAVGCTATSDGVAVGCVCAGCCTVGDTVER